MLPLGQGSIVVARHRNGTRRYAASCVLALRAQLHLFRYGGTSLAPRPYGTKRRCVMLVA